MRLKPNKLFPGLPNYSGPTKGIFGLLHHDRAIEFSANVMERVLYVRQTKPADEQPTRLRAIVYIAPELLPADYAKAWADWDKARADWAKTWADYAKARADWDNAWMDCAPEITALLHKLVPNCPWNGKTIVFPTSTKGVT